MFSRIVTFILFLSSTTWAFDARLRQLEREFQRGEPGSAEKLALEYRRGGKHTSAFGLYMGLDKRPDLFFDILSLLAASSIEDLRSFSDRLSTTYGISIVTDAETAALNFSPFRTTQDEIYMPITVIFKLLYSRSLCSTISPRVRSIHLYSEFPGSTPSNRRTRFFTITCKRFFAELKIREARGAHFITSPMNIPTSGSVATAARTERGIADFMFEYFLPELEGLDLEEQILKEQKPKGVLQSVTDTCRSFLEFWF